MLTTQDVATHFSLGPDTIRARIRAGDLRACRINRDYRLRWEDVWSCERGPMPGRARAMRYRTPLLTKKDVAAAVSVNVRTVERWIATGMPTRNVFGAVRMNRDDVSDWLKVSLDLDLPAGWWR